jgi:hypothetical protein
MKNIIATVISLFLALISFSQSRLNSFSFSTGVSFPAGQFGNSTVQPLGPGGEQIGFLYPYTGNLYNNKAGFAKTGLHFNVLFEHKINKSLAVTALLFGQRNAVDISTLEKGFSGRVYYIGSDPQRPISFSNWKFDEKNWLYTGCLVGGSNEFKIMQHNELFVKLKALAGITYVSLPKLNGSSITTNKQAGAAQSNSSAAGFCYLFSTGLKYNYNKKCFLLFDIQYLRTGNIKSKNVTQNFNAKVESSGSPGIFETWGFTRQENIVQRIATLNVIVGAGFKF